MTPKMADINDAAANNQARAGENADARGTMVVFGKTRDEEEEEE